MTATYVTQFLTMIFLKVYVPSFITCGMVYFIVLFFRRVSRL